MIPLKRLAALALLAPLGFASSASASCQVKGCTSHITGIYPTHDASGKLYFSLDPALDLDLVDCTPALGKYFTLNKSHPLFKETYARMMIADVEDSPVYARIKEGSDNCSIAYILFRS